MTVDIVWVELEVDVVFCCAKEVVELEFVVVELVVLGLAGGLVVPPNWISIALEMTKMAMTATTKVDRFAARLVMA